MKIRTFKYLLFFVSLNVLIFSFLSLDAQNKEINFKADENNFYVEWLSKISSVDDLNSQKSFLRSVKDFIFGKSNISLVKPVNLVAIDSNLIFVLDQGIQFPVQINRISNTIDYQFEKISYPSLLGICKWEQNKILFTDSKLNGIYFLNSDDESPKTLNEKLNLNQPTGIGFNAINNEIWVCETGSHQIQILDMSGNIVKTIGKRGNQKEEFNFPTHLWIDFKGNAYIVDALNFRIQIFNKNGEFIRMFGETGDSPGYFSSIKGIATDSFGHIYIVDALFNVIQVFDQEGNFLYNFGGTGKNNGELYLPTGIYITPDNTIYIADTYNSRIQFFKLKRGNN